MQKSWICSVLHLSHRLAYRVLCGGPKGSSAWIRTHSSSPGVLHPADASSAFSEVLLYAGPSGSSWTFFEIHAVSPRLNSRPSAKCSPVSCWECTVLLTWPVLGCHGHCSSRLVIIALDRITRALVLRALITNPVLLEETDPTSATTNTANSFSMPVNMVANEWMREKENENSRADPLGK